MLGRIVMGLGLIAISAVLLVVFHNLGMLERIIPVSIEQQVDLDSLECAAAAAIADSKGEGGANRQMVQARIIEATRRYSERFNTSICDVFEKGLTMIPPGQKRSAFYVGRRRGYVRRVDATAAEWNATLALAKRILSNPLPEGCATVYIRAPRGTWTEGAETIAAIKKMKPAPREPNARYEAQFFCP